MPYSPEIRCLISQGLADLRDILTRHPLAHQPTKQWSRYSKEDVLDLCAELLAEEPAAEDVRKIETLQCGLQGPPVPRAEEASVGRGFRLRGKSFLFTWNVGVPEDPHAEWCAFLAWRTRQATGKYKSVRYSATCEESLASEHSGRVHIHEQRELCTDMDETGLGGFVYTNMAGVPITPNVSRNYLDAIGDADSTEKGRGPAYRASCDRAHFYVQANKYGTLFVETDWAMQREFRVNNKWLDDLAARGKISRDQWVDYAAEGLVGFSTRKRNADAVGAYQKAKAIELDSVNLLEQIAQHRPKRPWRKELVLEAQARRLPKALVNCCFEISRLIGASECWP